MSFEMASALAQVTVLAQVGSTFDVVDPAAGHLATWVTLDQRSGRGRLGRAWVAPPGRCLAASIVVRPSGREDAWGWLPLVTGLALAEALDPLVAELPAAARAGAQVGVKWPNDVLVGGRKVAGILCERRGDAIVVGLGVNLTLADDELPTERATSLRLAGVEGEAEQLADRVLAGVLAGLERHAMLADPAVHAAVAARCSTIGEHVRVLLPGERVLAGVATGLGQHGELDVDTDDGPRRVSAGDVTHLR